MDKKHFEKQFPSLKKNVFWEKQKTSERITKDRIDYENACVDVSQVAQNCIDKSNIHKLPAGDFIIVCPELDGDKINKFAKRIGNSLSKRKEMIYIVNTPFIRTKIEKIMSNPNRKEIYDLIKQRKLTITEISKKVGLSYRNTFFHIKTLRELDLVRTEKDHKSQGRKVYVLPTDKTPKKIIEEKENNSLSIKPKASVLIN